MDQGSFFIINKAAQGKIGFHEAVDWFDSLPQESQKGEIQNLMNFIRNAIHDKEGYQSEIYQQAIKTIPLKKTHTPVILLNTFPIKIAFNKLGTLPFIEFKKCFISLLWVFKQLDTHRRNTECLNGCGHSWHNLE